MRRMEFVFHHSESCFLQKAVLLTDRREIRNSLRVCDWFACESRTKRKLPILILIEERSDEDQYLSVATY
ncbi:hypothetical protein RaK2_00076 [Klebsiella phage vB_KleM_RaK2]|uniref:Uncharacterized protein n=1 Tax=Klebsiella phage vB_KleM_RaK2 TaxID=1147094 RepID=H6X3N3_9CAUD|nr:hypothetical protein F403_gp459 [Klebsiella phage vB_KleM_RaK2]AFA44349.1 hypothetical protein RaK2_00076 [Klebsiella phage vB_KleM_RaK2]